RKIPVVERLAGVDALIALETDQRDVEGIREGVGERGLAGARSALEQQRPLHAQSQIADGGEALVSQISGGSEASRQLCGTVDGEHACLPGSWSHGRSRSRSVARSSHLPRGTSCLARR